MKADVTKPEHDNNDHFGLPMGEFKPTASPRNKRWVKVTIVVAGIALLLGTGVVVWLLQNPSANLHYLRSQKAQESQAELLQAHESDSPIAIQTSADNNQQSPVIPIIDSPTGMYYVVLSSYIDIDLARDQAKKLIQEGKSVKLIMPQAGQHFVRLTMGETASHEAAASLANDLKPQYGQDIWVLKY